MASKDASLRRQAKIMEALQADPENKLCAECRMKGATWASTNLGVFLCIRCSGIHRALGVHISKVKSISLDTWRPEQLEEFQKIGNRKAAQVWEARLPPSFIRPTEDDRSMELFIRNKYERRLYYAPPSQAPQESPPSHQPVPVANAAQVRAQPQAAPRADLLSVDSFSSPPAHAAKVASASNDLFSDPFFSDASFGQPQAQAQQQVQAQAQQQQLDKESILSLYHQPMVPQGGMQGAPAYGAMSMAGGYGMMNQGMPMNAQMNAMQMGQMGQMGRMGQMGPMGMAGNPYGMMYNPGMQGMGMGMGQMNAMMQAGMQQQQQQQRAMMQQGMGMPMGAYQQYRPQ